MPAIVIYGIPKNLHMHLTMSVYRYQEIPNAASSIPGMGITPDVVTVITPVDEGCSGKEIIAFIEGLFQRPGRTPEARQQLAIVIRDCLVELAGSMMEDCRKVEVYPRSQSADDGFSIWEKDAVSAT
jgi:hypothetical protein